MIDCGALADLNDTVLGPQHKSLPRTAWGRTIRDYLRTEPTLDQLSTPLLTVDRTALQSNLTVVADWARSAGVLLAPHGKTTMAPQLWALQLEAGAWGITVATPWQAQLARSFGVSRIMLANAMVDPVALDWLAEELRTDPSFEFCCWADSVAIVELMERALKSAPPVKVIVELGGPGGRTGARSVDEAMAVAEAIDRAPRLTLAGVGGWEGMFGHDREPAALSNVRGYLDRLAQLFRQLAAAGLCAADAIVTAGGSAYQDLVAERLAGLDEYGLRTSVIVRSGASLIHDDGFYADISPLSAGRVERPLRSAMHAWARTVSRPEPELALLDAGKRDLPFDAGLPVPQRFDGTDPLAAGLEGAAITALNAQHAFLRLPGGTADAVPVGSVVRLGLSDPCSTFDKWRLIPVVDDADAANPRIVDFLHTFF